MITWEIQRQKANGSGWSDPASFEDTGIVDAQRQLVNQAADTCGLSFVGMRPPKVGGLRKDEIIRILRNGAGWFTGRVLAPVRDARGTGESATVQLNGPWSDLDRVIFCQVGLYYQKDTANLNLGPVIGGTQFQPGASPVLTSTVLLGQNDLTGAPIPAGDSIKDALAYGISKGARFQVGDVNIAQVIPAAKVTDQTCAGIIKQVLKWMVDVTVWFDYTTDPPTLNMKARSNRAALTLQMGDGNPAQPPQVANATLQARPDLVISGVALQYVRQVDTQTDSATGSVSASINTLETDTAGADPYGLGGIVATIELTGGTLDTTGAGNNGLTFEPPPVGLAQTLFAASSILHYQGTINLKAQDTINGGNWIGKVVNIAGGDEDWTNMRAAVQSARDSMAKGESQLTVGPPVQLGPADLAALLTANRSRVPVTGVDTTTRTGGTAIVPPTNPTPPNPPPGTLRTPKDPPEQPGDDGSGPETTTHLGFAKGIRVMAGTKTEPDWTNTGKYYYNKPGGGPGDAPVYRDPPTDGPKTDVGAGEVFYAAYEAGCLCWSGGACGHEPGNAWFNRTSWSGSHTIGTLDLTGFPALTNIYAVLRGTHTYTLADRTSKTEPVEIDVTGYLGLRFNGFSVIGYMPKAAQYYFNPNDSENAEVKTENITFDTLFVKGRGKPPR